MTMGFTLMVLILVEGGTSTILQPLGPLMCEKLGQMSGTNMYAINANDLSCTLTDRYVLSERTEETEKILNPKKEDICNRESTGHSQTMEMRSVMCTEIPEPMEHKRCQTVDGHIICSVMKGSMACVFTSKISVVGGGINLRTRKQWMEGINYSYYCGKESGLSRIRRVMRCALLSRLDLKKTRKPDVKQEKLSVDDVIPSLCMKAVKQEVCQNAIVRSIDLGNIKVLHQLILKTPEQLNCRREIIKSTPIMIATHDRQDNIVNLLLALGADLTLADKYSRTLLHHVCHYGTVKQLKLLKNLGLNVKTKKGMYDRSPLLTAAYGGNFGVFKYLLSIGCDANDVSTIGTTIIHEACKATNILVLKYILERNISKFNMESKDDFGQTPVLTAASRGRVNIVEYIYKMGCNMKAKDIQGNTILHLAVVDVRSDEFLKFVVPLNVVDINCTNKDGKTAFMLANESKRESKARYLKDMM